MSASPANAKVFTVGYEGRNIDEFVQSLRQAGVDRVVDIRELPLSRRKGFSKRGLNDALAAGGIEYVHLRSAGNPFRKEKADIDRCLALYAAHLEQHPEVLGELEAVMDGHRTALLCVERDSHVCHRGVIAKLLKERQPTMTILHL